MIYQANAEEEEEGGARQAVRCVPALAHKLAFRRDTCLHPLF